jgi:CRP/FNR family transcriptional regulator, cyclic AMP receptor protein
MPAADLLGWLAAALMVSTFACREPARMRPLAVATNLAFIGYGLAASLPPVFALHALLLPINLWHWLSTSRGMDKAARTAPQCARE